MSKIFITGAPGFIGNSLAKKLSINNQILSDADDILKPESLISGFMQCDILFHCAAFISFSKKDFNKAYRVNVEGTRNVLEAAYKAGVKRVVYLSACAVLGFSQDKNKILDEGATPEIKKSNVYAYTKKLAENEVKKYAQKGLNVSIANITTVYGEGDRKLNSGAIIKSVYEGRLNFVPPGGTSFVSIGDLVEGLILLAEKGRAGERYIFCAENMEYKVLAERIAGVLQVKAPHFTLPRFTYYPALGAVKLIELFSGIPNKKINLITAQILEESYGYKYFNSQKAKDELGWRPKKSLEEAVSEAFEYYKREGLIK